MSGRPPLGDVVIFGAGGHARECGWIATCAGWDVSAYLERAAGATGAALPEAPVIIDDEFFSKPKPLTSAHIGIGDGALRRAIASRFEDKCAWVRLVHPTALLAPSASVGEGSVIFPLACISVNARLGSHVVVNVGASLSHDVLIGDYATIGPGARIAGNVEVGEGATIGVGASVKNGTADQPLRIGAGATIGAGAVVVSDVPDGAVSIGVPAKPIKVK